MNKKVLMICYYFPPLLDVGCKRSVAFSKYLKLHGWEPYVLSVRNPDKRYCQRGNDRPPSGVSVTYVWSLFNLFWLFGKMHGLLHKVCALLGFNLRRNYFHDFFSIPDLFMGLIPGAVIGGYRIIKKKGVGFIYVSCSPFSSAVAGLVLKRICGKPLIIDFRDPMAVNLPDRFNVPSFRKKINKSIERKIINAADVFIVNTEEVRSGYVEAYPEIAYKTITIHNGFDHEMLPEGRPEKFGKFTIAYGGNMYLPAIKSSPFFEALGRLKRSKKISRENFQFLYYGPDNQSMDQIAGDHGVADLVFARPSISHAEMLKILSKSHLQLLRIVKPMISTKLFEGIALNLPFLATIPSGEVSDIIRKYSPSSYIVPEESTEAIEEAVIDAMKTYQKDEVQDNLVNQFFSSFSREAMTQKLEQAFVLSSSIQNSTDKRLSN